jgi:hypothetical protein
VTQYNNINTLLDEIYICVDFLSFFFFLKKKKKRGGYMGGEIRVTNKTYIYGVI